MFSQENLGAILEKNAPSIVTVKVVLKIDPSAKMPGGQELNDIVDFKQMLLTRENQVIRCLCEKLLTYATGRLLEVGDRGEVDRIVSEMKENGNRLRDLVHLVVQSDLFSNK